MQEVVIHGIVEVMNERQMEARTKSLQSAISRMSEAREARGGFVSTIDMEIDDQPKRGRRRLFSFGDRARTAVDDNGNVLD